MRTLGLAVALAMIAACGGDDDSDGDQADDAGQETLTVNFNTFWPSTILGCPVTPLDDGMDMLVEDGDGTTIGVVRFGAPSWADDECVWEGQADVTASDFYAVTAANGEVFTTMSHAELEQAGWQVDIE
jgi:hypothetical protein